MVAEQRKGEDGSGEGGKQKVPGAETGKSAQQVVGPRDACDGEERGQLQRMAEQDQERADGEESKARGSLRRESRGGS